MSVITYCEHCSGRKQLRRFRGYSHQHGDGTGLLDSQRSAPSSSFNKVFYPYDDPEIISLGRSPIELWPKRGDSLCAPGVGHSQWPGPGGILRGFDPALTGYGPEGRGDTHSLKGGHPDVEAILTTIWENKHILKDIEDIMNSKGDACARLVSPYCEHCSCHGTGWLCEHFLYGKEVRNILSIYGDGIGSLDSMRRDGASRSPPAGRGFALTAEFSQLGGTGPRAHRRIFSTCGSLASCFLEKLAIA